MAMVGFALVVNWLRRFSAGDSLRDSLFAFPEAFDSRLLSLMKLNVRDLARGRRFWPSMTDIAYYGDE